MNETVTVKAAFPWGSATYSYPLNGTPCEACKTPATLTNGFCPACAAILIEIPQSRVKEMWDNRNLQSIPKYTDAEWTIVRSLWDRIPSGASSWMSAFYHFLRFTRRIQEQTI